MKSLDIEDPTALVAYLHATERIAVDETPVIQKLAGGVSNRTVLVKRSTGEAWVLKQALTKLRVSVDWFSSPERVHREALGLHWLAQISPAGVIPQLIFEDHTHHLIAMTAVPEPHTNWKTLLLAGQLDLKLVEQFALLLATIHGQAIQRQAVLAPIFADRSFFESLRLEPYYAYTASQIPAAASFLQDLIAATRQRTITLVHGDYSPKNTLVYQQRLVLLDYEVIHWGDPAFDLGFSLTHFLSKAHHLPAMRRQFADAAQYYWRHYRETLASNGGTAGVNDECLELYAVRHTLACMLARVAGRSPLEYMAAESKTQQRAIICELMQAPISEIETLITCFIERLE